MKAIRVDEFGGPEVMRLVDLPDPQPEAGQVLVRVHAAGVNPVDAYIRTGTYARMPPLPYTPGIDGAGVSLPRRERQARCRGERVDLAGSISGTYAESALRGRVAGPPVAAKCFFRAGSGDRCPLRHRLSRPLSTSARSCRESGLSSRRERRSRGGRRRSWRAPPE